MIESDKKPFGLISVLNDCCLAPGDPTDAQFLGQMDSQFASHPHYASFASSKSLGRTQFVVKHYAGDVAYTVDGFLDANNDLLYRDLKVAMLQAKNTVINSTFLEAELDVKKRPETAGTQFRKNMNDLMAILMAKEPSYVRCIKPNGEKKVRIVLCCLHIAMT
jgi:myosin I